MSPAIVPPLQASAKSIIWLSANRLEKRRRRCIWWKSGRSTQGNRRVSSVEQLSCFIVQVVAQSLHKER
jgi:hypothetical protein